MLFSLHMLRLGIQNANVIASTAHINNISIISSSSHHRNFVPITASALCADPLVIVIKTGLTAIIAVLRALSVALTIHGIVMGGLTRMLSFGNAQRIAQSNREIIQAIVGLIIVMLSVPVGNQIPVWFGLANHTCLISPPGFSIQS